MRITDFSVDGFGIWRDLSMNDLSDRITVIFGENEAGKTTLMHFVRTILYGFSPDRHRRYVPPVNGGRPGGQIGIALPHGQYQVRRILKGSQTGAGEVEITSADGTYHRGHQLITLLGGIDESIFSNVFSVGLREIQQLSTLNDTQAAQHLYDLTTGMDRVSLFEVMRELTASRQRLASDDDRPSQLTQLFAEQQKLEDELRQLRNQTNQWVELAAQVRSASEEVAHLENKVSTLERESRLVEIAFHVHHSWKQRAEIDAQFDQLGPVATVPDDELEQFEQLATAIGRHRTEIREIKKRRKSLKQQASLIEVNDKLWRRAARVEALNEQKSWIHSLNDQIGRLENEIVELEGHLLADQRQLGIAKDRTLGAGLPDLSQKNLAALREPGREVREQKQRLDDAQQEAEHCEETAREIEERIRRELSDRGVRDLNEALEQAGKKVSQLRRSSQTDDRLEQLKLQRRQVQEETQLLMSGQVLPVRALTGLGAMFILGIVLLMVAITSPLFSMTGGTAWVLAFLGMIALMFTAGLKFGLERSASRELDDCQRQEDLIQRQIDKLVAERGYQDEDGPGVVPNEQLRAAERDLAELEELLPLESHRERALQDMEDARRRASHANEEVQSARNRWRSTLKSLGLPPTLTPKQVKQLSVNFKDLEKKFAHINERRQELERRQKELTSVASRTAHLFTETGIEPRNPDPAARIEQLAEALAAQEQSVACRNELRQEYRELGKEQELHVRAGKQLVRQQRESLREIGVDDEEDLLELVEKIQLVRQLRVSHKELCTKITAAMGGAFSDDDLAACIEESSQLQLETRLETLMTEYDRASDRLKGIYERRGRLTEQMESLSEDRRLAEVQLQLACVEQRIAEATQQWQVLALVSTLLEEIRALYEADRQPESLRDASNYLKKLTRGRYCRIWTPLGDNVLNVDDAEDRTLSVELLSRGTRELVYLSLRLALAAAYARRGIILPLILDDVLVNFDTRRADAAAKVLKEFSAAGHQLLVFTCHEHIMRIFRQLDVEVRELPSRREPAPSQVTLELPPPPVVEEIEEEEELLEAEDEFEEVEEELEEEEDEDLELAEDDLEEPEEEFEFTAVESEPEEEEPEEELELEPVAEEENEVVEQVLLEIDEEPEEEKPAAEYTTGETEWLEDNEFSDPAFEYIDDDEAARRVAWQDENQWNPEGDDQPQDEAEAA